MRSAEAQLPVKHTIGRTWTSVGRYGINSRYHMKCSCGKQFNGNSISTVLDTHKRHAKRETEKSDV